MGGERTLRLIFYDDAYLYAIQTSIHLLVLNLNIIASIFCILSSYLPPHKDTRNGFPWPSSRCSMTKKAHAHSSLSSGSQCSVLELVFGGSPTITITQHTLTYCTIHATVSYV
jgi:hypothetical protein